MRRGREQGFSKVKAAKARSRASVGTPPVERVLEDPKRKAARLPRHRETLEQLLTLREPPASKQEEGEAR